MTKKHREEGKKGREKERDKEGRKRKREREEGGMEGEGERKEGNFSLHSACLGSTESVNDLVCCAATRLYYPHGK